MDRDRMNAIILANALVYTSPYGDKNSASRRQSAWRNFLDSLDWKKMKEKATKKFNPLQALLGTGKIPIVSSGKKEER